MLLRFLGHHADAADPELLDAIMHRIDSIVPLGPVGMIIVLTAFILAIPLSGPLHLPQIPQGCRRRLAAQFPSRSCTKPFFIDTLLAQMLYFPLA